MTKIVKTTNRDCRRYVRNCVPFDNSNKQLYARWTASGLYVVYSYGEHWPLFVWDAANETWYSNEDKYSMTTSHHYSYAHPHEATEHAPCHWLRRFIQDHGDAYYAELRAKRAA